MFLIDEVVLICGVQKLGGDVEQRRDRPNRENKIAGYFARKAPEFMYHEKAHLLDKRLRDKNQFSR